MCHMTSHDRSLRSAGESQSRVRACVPVMAEEIFEVQTWKMYTLKPKHIGERYVRSSSLAKRYSSVLVILEVLSSNPVWVTRYPE
jgi:hypothetical protein